MEEMIFNVRGMMCEGCEKRVKNAVGALDGVKSVSADHNTGKVTVSVEGKITRELIEETIEDIGYEINKKE